MTGTRWWIARAKHGKRSSIRSNWWPILFRESVRPPTERWRESIRWRGRSFRWTVHTAECEFGGETTFGCPIAGATSRQILRQVEFSTSRKNQGQLVLCLSGWFTEMAGAFIFPSHVWHFFRNLFLPPVFLLCHWKVKSFTHKSMGKGKRILFSPYAPGLHGLI